MRSAWTCDASFATANVSTIGPGEEGFPVLRMELERVFADEESLAVGAQDARRRTSAQRKGQYFDILGTAPVNGAGGVEVRLSGEQLPAQETSRSVGNCEDMRWSLSR